MYRDKLDLPKVPPQNPDEIEPEPEEEEDEELEPEEEEEQARAENGEVCAVCGEEFEDANGSPSLCPECYAAAEESDTGLPHEPLSRYPVVKS